MKRLKGNYNKIALRYIQEFSRKHGLIFDGWIGGRIGEVAEFSDYYFDYRDIRTDIDLDVNPGKIFNWYDKDLEAGMNGEIFMNYENYLK